MRHCVEKNKKSVEYGVDYDRLTFCIVRPMPQPDRLSQIQELTQGPGHSPRCMPVLDRVRPGRSMDRPACNEVGDLIPSSSPRSPIRGDPMAPTDNFMKATTPDSKPAGRKAKSSKGVDQR